MSPRCHKRTHASQQTILLKKRTAPSTQLHTSVWIPLAPPVPQAVVTFDAAFLSAAASDIVGGASSGLAPAASVSTSQSAGSGGPVDYYVDTLLRSNPTAKPDTADLGSVRHEIARILTTGLRDGDVAAPDRTYVAQVVAARTGLSQADADTRVSNVINQAKTDLDNARKAAAKLSLWLTASLLIGAFSASLAATDGGYVRDRNASLTEQ